MPERRAAARAVSRARGRMPSTFHGRPNFILSPTLRTSVAKAWDPRRRVNGRSFPKELMDRAQSSASQQTFSGLG
jgi:hypothetical protein